MSEKKLYINIVIYLCVNYGSDNRFKEKLKKIDL